jgi:7-carboxy-7-deazaguanine synthase
MHTASPNGLSSDSQAALIRVCEIYESVQGEGLLTGTPSIFIRTSGCNLRCWFCDTPFASWKPEGRHLTAAEIIASLAELAPKHAELAPKHVVLTGGEPMIFQSIGHLTHALRRHGYHLTIETAGTLWRDIECDLWSISPKLASSAPKPTEGSWHTAHHRRRHRPDVVRQMMQGSYQLKFVVDNLTDAQEVVDYLDELGDYDRERVLLMPQGVDPQTLDRQAQWLIPWCQKHQFRYCPRQHIYWFGNRRGT